MASCPDSSKTRYSIAAPASQQLNAQLREAQLVGTVLRGMESAVFVSSCNLLRLKMTPLIMGMQVTSNIDKLITVRD